MFCPCLLGDKLDSGLGQSEYSTVSKTGEIAQKALQVVFPLAALNFEIPIVGGFLKKAFGGLFKKATKMESCMKWWSDDNLRSIAGSVKPISLDDVYRQYPQYSQLFSVLRASGGGDFLGLRQLISSGARVYKMQNYFIQYARQANAENNLFEVYCAAQHRDETGVPFTTDVLAPIWQSIREAASQREYDETMDEVYKRLDSYIKPALEAQQRGQVYTQTLKVGKTEVSPVKATFKYTPSGVPLAVVGELPCQCGRFPV
jgi:hypothetical protein